MGNLWFFVYQGGQKGRSRRKKLIMKMMRFTQGVTITVSLYLTINICFIPRTHKIKQPVLLTWNLSKTRRNKINQLVLLTLNWFVMCRHKIKQTVPLKLNQLFSPSSTMYIYLSHQTIASSPHKIYRTCQWGISILEIDILKGHGKPLLLIALLIKVAVTKS